MILNAYVFEKSPREFVNWEMYTPLLLNRKDGNEIISINLNVNDYIDTTLIVNDKQLGIDITDNNFKEIGGICSIDNQSGTEIVWYWRVVNRIRIRRGQWELQLQADAFLNWDLSAHPIKANKLNVLNSETFPLIAQSFHRYPYVQRDEEIIDGNVKGLAVVYATQPLAISGENISNQYTLNTSPPIIETMPEDGTQYYTGIIINECISDFACGISLLTGSLTKWDYRVFRVFNGGNKSDLSHDQVVGGSQPNTIGELTFNSFSPSTQIGKKELSGAPFGIKTSMYQDFNNIKLLLDSLIASPEYKGRPVDQLPTILKQNENKYFVKDGVIYKLVLTNVVTEFTEISSSNTNMTIAYEIYLSNDTKYTTINTPIAKKISGSRNFIKVKYERIGVADDIYKIVWDENVTIIPNMAGASVYAYAFQFNNQLTAESLISYFYKTYGSLIQDSQWFDDLSIDDINTKSVLANIKKNSIAGETLFSIYNITDSSTTKSITSRILDNYLAMTIKDKLYNTIYLIAPDGSNLIEVDRNITSNVIHMEYDLLPIEGKCYARFNYNNINTGIYNSTDTQKMIVWKAGRFSGALSAYVEYSLQNSTFQQITNAQFNNVENTNKQLDAQAASNLNYNKAAQEVSISQAQSNANYSLAGGILNIGAGIASGNKFAIGSSIGQMGSTAMGYAQSQANIDFQKQQNAIDNQRTAYNNGIASQLRANELATSRRVNDLNIQAIRDRPNIIVPSNGVSIKRTEGMRICMYSIPQFLSNIINDTARRFGYDLDIIWTWSPEICVMGNFMYLPYTPRVNEFLNSMLSAGLYKNNYTSMGDNIILS